MSQHSTSFDRAADLRQLQEKAHDLLIVGGGIVGAGIARDASLRGMSVALVEQDDFAFGTSSRSSRLLHGGLRYLAQGRVGLVHEASVEKKVIHEIAPHLAQPLPFIFPTYSDNKNWILWQLKIGVKIYDLLCGGRNLASSSWLSRRQVMDKVPGLSGVGLKGAVRYYDGFTNDSRLTLDTLRSAALAGGSVVNYCGFESCRRDGEFWDCRVRDVLTGREIRARAAHVVNATGPWADGLQHSRVKLRITKGIHLVVERSRLPLPETVVMTEGKRILFAIPWGERVIVGTTDTDYSGPLDKVFSDSQDIAYVLEVANRCFPKAHLTSIDVISSWAGLRPLLADPNGKPSDISRSHEIRNPEPGWWDVAGGKLTTYRLMAEQAVDRIAKQLGRPSLRECTTALQPVLPADAVEFSGIVPPTFSRRAVEHFVRQEWAIHLDDVMVRRSSWHCYYRDAYEKAAAAARWMAELLTWSDATERQELARYQERTSPLSASQRGRPENTPSQIATSA